MDLAGSVLVDQAEYDALQEELNLLRRIFIEDWQQDHPERMALYRAGEREGAIGVRTWMLSLLRSRLAREETVAGTGLLELLIRDVEAQG